MEREYFLFRKEWCDAISGLSPRLRYEILDAIIRYGITGESGAVLGKMTGLVFGMAKAVIDRDNEELEEKDARLKSLEMEKAQRIEQLRQNGKKGGRPSKNVTDDEKPKEKPKVKPMVSSKNPVSDTLSPRARVIEYNNKNKEDINIIDNQKIEKESKKKETEKGDSTHEVATVDVKAFIGFFNDEMTKANTVIPHQCVCTEKRVTAVTARAREHGMESLRTMVVKAAKSNFLNGCNAKNWVASLDWLLRPNNFVKVIEGNYDNDRTKYLHGNQRQTYDRRHGWDAVEHTDEEYNESF